jgi:glycosyltransferase involved in cell wall biosynthesis
MKRNARFIAWQPVLTDHQAFTLQELSRQSGATVIAYVMRLEDSVRQAQGWADTQVKTIERRLLPPAGTLRHCYQRLREHRQDIHLFGSPFEQPKMMLTLLMAALLGINFYLISEPYSPRTEGYFDDAGAFANRIKARLRPMAYRCYALLIRRRVSGVFAISSLAIAQYRRSGLPASKLFPFGYFVPRSIEQTKSPNPADNAATRLRIVFVGSLIQRKGIDLLITAVSRLLSEGHSVSLDAFGPGNPESLSFDATRIRYCGLIPFGHVQEVITSYDVMALPSRFDGWGVVVNEALCAHVPVVCSSQVGARAIVEKFGAGSIFTADDPYALYLALKDLLQEPQRLGEMRESATRAACAIEPAVAATYMLSVIRADPPMKASIASPWYGKPEDSHA